MTHSFPTRRSSDLNSIGGLGGPDALTAFMIALIWPTDRETRPYQSTDHALSSGGLNSAGKTSGQLPCNFSPQRSLSRSEEHTSELQSLMRISYAVFCLKKKNKYTTNTT